MRTGLPSYLLGYGMTVESPDGGTLHGTELRWGLDVTDCGIPCPGWVFVPGAKVTCPDCIAATASNAAD